MSKPCIREMKLIVDGAKPKNLSEITQILNMHEWTAEQYGKELFDNRTIEVTEKLRMYAAFGTTSDHPND